MKLISASLAAGLTMCLLAPIIGVLLAAVVGVAVGNIIEREWTCDE